MPNPPANPSLDLIGVGAPIMDLVASVPDSFLPEAGGEKGGMVMVDADEMTRLVGKLPRTPAVTNGGSAANTTYNAARLGLRAAFTDSLGLRLGYDYESASGRQRHSFNGSLRYTW